MWHKLFPLVFHFDLRISVHGLLESYKGLRFEERCFEAATACCYALSRLHLMFDLHSQKPFPLVQNVAYRVRVTASHIHFVHSQSDPISKRHVWLLG